MGETEEQTKKKSLNRLKSKEKARRTSQELAEFLEDKYGYDGKSTKSKRDDSKEKHNAVLNEEAIA